MTILQLKYVITIANSSSMREAASKLYVSQPALSATIRELEQELNIKIFERNNKGINVTEQGREFVNYAKQAVNQYEIIEDRYFSGGEKKKHFSVSMQHYVFGIHAFVNALKKIDYPKYNYSVSETRTEEVLSDVRKQKSEVGIIAYTKSNEAVIKKLFREFNLEFFPLFHKESCAYVWKEHPLAGEKELSLEDLREYPFLSFDQSSDSEFYLSEEPLSDYDFPKIIKSTDRATSAELMAALNGYSIGTGAMTKSISLKDEFLSIKLKEQDPVTVGYILLKNHKLSEIGKTYVEELKKIS